MLSDRRSVSYVQAPAHSLARIPTPMPSPASRTPLAVGTIVDGKYPITAVRSTDDDTCIVYEANHELLGKFTLTEIYPVGVLTRAADGVTLEPTSPEKAEQLKRGFDLVGREVRAWGAIKHPTIATVQGYWFENGTMYLSTQWIGDLIITDLRQPGLDRRGLDEEETIHLAITLLEGLSLVHERGLIHGNISPRTIRLDRRYRPVIAPNTTVRRAWFDLDDDATEVNASPFASPEQIANGELGAFVDVYAFAATFYTVLTGRPPSSAFNRLTKREPVVPPHELVRRVRPTFEAALLCGLSLDHRQRFANAREFLDAMTNLGPAEFGTLIHEDELLDSLAETSVVEMLAAKLNLVEPSAGEANEAAQPKPAALDENVQFTVYRPGTVRPAEWNTMLAFAHLSEAREGTSDPDPVEVVERQAMQVLESRRDEYTKVVHDSSQAVPREGTLTFVPTVDGMEFNPRQRSFQWIEDVQREEFRFRASNALNGKVARGRMTVYHGAIILAEISLSIKVDAGYQAASSQPPTEAAHARPFRRIFASYSHKDLEIVRQFERFATTLGDRYLRDWNELRAGEIWNDRLMELITEADVFQLFWSRNAMTSQYVKQEWEYALSLGRPNFVRPTYWEDPLPETSDGNLPPAALKQLHFQRIALADTPSHAPHSMRSAEPPRAAAVAAHASSRSSEPPPNYRRTQTASYSPPVSVGGSSSGRAESVGSYAPMHAPSAEPAAASSAGRLPLRAILTALLVIMLLVVIVFAVRTFH